MGFIKSFCLAVMLICLTSVAYAAPEVPQLKAPVMDLAQMLSPHARQEINQDLLAYDRIKGSQIVVLTVPTLGGGDLFDYGTHVFDQWQLGRKNIDDGVLILIVQDVRKIQIFVGSGLEGAIPDAYAKRIITEIMTPQFREGNIDNGVTLAVHQIQKLIEGENLPEPNLHQADEADWTTVLGLYVFLYFFGIAYYLKKIFGKTLGTLFFVSPTFLVSFLMGLPWSMTLILAFIALFASFLPPPNMGSGRGGRGGGGRSSRGGFSGGGGGFRGGGASGGW